MSPTSAYISIPKLSPCLLGKRKILYASDTKLICPTLPKSAEKLRLTLATTPRRGILFLNNLFCAAPLSLVCKIQVSQEDLKLDAALITVSLQKHRNDINVKENWMSVSLGKTDIFAWGPFKLTLKSINKLTLEKERIAKKNSICF